MRIAFLAVLLAGCASEPEYVIPLCHEVTLGPTDDKPTYAPECEIYRAKDERFRLMSDGIGYRP